MISRFKLCYHCLGSGHQVAYCKYNPGSLCGVRGCKRFQHKLLHPSTKSTVLFEDRDSDCSALPDLEQINFEDLESGSEDSGEGAEQSEAFHTVWPEMELSVFKL